MRTTVLARTALRARIGKGMAVLPGKFDGPPDEGRTHEPLDVGVIRPQSPTVLTIVDTQVGKERDAITKGGKFLYIWGPRNLLGFRGQITPSGELMTPHDTTFCFEYDRILDQLVLCRIGNVMY